MMKNKICTTQDYLVSGETFDILWDESKGYSTTDPKPLEEKLAAYYKSEDYISHNQNGRSFVIILYTFSRKKMFRIKTKMFKNELSSNDSILDYGCGTGDFLEYAANKSYKIDGVEPNLQARSQALEKRIPVVESWNKLPDKKFNLITLWHVFEHILDLDGCIKEFNLRLKSKGILLIAVPNLRSYDAAYYKEYWAAYDVPRHLWHFSQEGIKKLLTSKNFELIAKHPLILDALYISYVSEKNKKARFPLIKGILRGIYSNIRAKKTREYSSLVYIFRKKN